MSNEQQNIESSKFVILDNENNSKSLEEIAEECSEKYNEVKLLIETALKYTEEISHPEYLKSVNIDQLKKKISDLEDLEKKILLQQTNLQSFIQQYNNNNNTLSTDVKEMILNISAPLKAAYNKIRGDSNNEGIIKTLTDKLFALQANISIEKIHDLNRLVEKMPSISSKHDINPKIIPNIPMSSPRSGSPIIFTSVNKSIPPSKPDTPNIRTTRAGGQVGGSSSSDY